VIGGSGEILYCRSVARLPGELCHVAYGCDATVALEHRKVAHAGAVVGQPDEVRGSPLTWHLCFVTDVVVAVDCDTGLDDVECLIHADTVLLTRREFSVPRSWKFLTIAQRNRSAERRVMAEQHLCSPGASQMRQVLVSEVLVREPAVTGGAQCPINRVGAAEHRYLDTVPKEVAAARDVHEILGHRDRLAPALDLLLQKRVMLVVAVEERNRDARGGHGVKESVGVGPVAEVAELEHHVGFEQPCCGRDEALPPRSSTVRVSNQKDPHPLDGAMVGLPRHLWLELKVWGLLHLAVAAVGFIRG
jgi:hypothetical protein